MVKVKFTESGGFAGLVKEHEVDSSDLSPDEAAQLTKLVKSSGIKSSDVQLSDTPRDLKQYDLTIDDGDREVSVTFDDQTVPEAAKPLIGYLKKRSGPTNR